MSSKMKGWIIGIGFIILLSIPIVIDYIKNNRIEVITYNDYVGLKSSSDFSLVYIGDTNAESYTEIKESLVAMKKDFKKINVQAVDYPSISEINLAELKNSFEATQAYAFIYEGKTIQIIEGATTLTTLKKIVDKYYNFILPEDEIKYNKVTEYEEYMNTINSKKVIMSVFGNDDCGWCKKFRVVYNDILQEHDLDIYYANSSVMNSNEWSKIMNSGLKIPAQCVKANVETPLSETFGTPLTLFTKNGKVIDCISGYYSTENLMEKLQTVGMIK